MDLKPELVKTIRRLSTQKNFDVLKNKLRSWLVTRELTVADLIRHCREKTISIPAVVLNKLGILYGSGKEGVLEDSDTAFWFYLAAADFGFGPANGNVAQYYYDGRAPGGRNIELAFQYCRKALELGTDKFMLMSEILHEREDYPETVRYLRKIIENRHSDNRRRIEARKLEIECLQKQLMKIFIKLSGSDSNEMAIMFPNNNIPAAMSATAGKGPARPHRLALQISTRMLSNAASSAVSPPPKSPMSLSLESSMRKLASVPYLPQPIPMRPMTPTNNSANNNLTATPLTPTNPSSNHYDKVHPSHYNPHRRGIQTNTHHFVSPHHQHRQYQTATYQHRLPGWFYVSDDLEGFDYNACAALTARAEVIELEAEAIKSAYETAELHVANARKHKFSEEIIQMLVKNKLHEFQDIYRTLEENKNVLLSTWNAYIDTTEHTLRRQVLTEKKFFQPGRMTNPLCAHLAQELFKRRLYQHAGYLDADWNMFFKPDEWLNEPLLLLNHSPFPYRIASSRTLITAERALLETATSTYGLSNSYQFTQQTGWTGKLNLHVFDPTHRDLPGGNPAQLQAEGVITTANNESKMMDMSSSNNNNGGGKSRRGMKDEDDVPPTSLLVPSQQYNVNNGNNNQAHHHAKHHSMSHLRAQIREQLVTEQTFTETIVIGSTTMRITHKTHPLLTTHHLQIALDSNRQQQTLLITQQGLSTATVNATLQAAQSSGSGNTSSNGHHKKHHSHHHHHHQSVGIGGHGTHPNVQLQQLIHQESLLEQALQHVRGDDYYFMDELGHSDEILSFLHHLTLIDIDPHFVDNERKIAEMMLRFTHDGTPIDLKELQLINEDATERDAQMLTKICFHYFIKRVVPWVLSFPDMNDALNNAGNSNSPNNSAQGSGLLGHSGGYRKLYELPLASGQARAMQLVRHGLLTFTELFSWDSEYGIFHCGVHREVVAAAVGTAASIVAATATNIPGNAEDNNNNKKSVTAGSGVSGAATRSTSPLRGSVTTSGNNNNNASSSAGNNNNSNNNLNSSSNNNVTVASAVAARHELAAAAAASEALLPEHPHAVIQTKYHDYEQMRRQLVNINALYQRAVLEVTPANFSATMQFWKSHKEGVSVPTYQRLRHELQECYGGEIDSDDEDEDDHSDNDQDHHSNSNIHRAKHHHGNEHWDHSQYGSEDRELDFLLSKLRI